MFGGGLVGPGDGCWDGGCGVVAGAGLAVIGDAGAVGLVLLVDEACVVVGDGDGVPGELLMVDYAYVVTPAEGFVVFRSAGASSAGADGFPVAVVSFYEEV